MAQTESSFWTDIKKFEDTLAKDPASYCFAPLAELYRKSGLLDDAISTALKGTALHPQYFGGYMALGRAYLDKGMNPEALDALQKVVALSPENILAQKLLSQIYMDNGDYALSKKALEAILALNPADTESRILLESLGRVAAPDNQDETDALESGDSGAFNFLVELDSSEVDAEELETLDLVEELEEGEGISSFFAEQEPLTSELKADQDEQSPLEDPVDYPVGIRTVTIAELYVTQGHLEQALDIYRELLEANPENLAHQKRIEELERLLAESELPSTLELPDDIFSSAEPEVMSFADDFSSSIDPAETPSSNAEGNDELVVLLQGWLDNIRRARECRSGRD